MKSLFLIFACLFVLTSCHKDCLTDGQLVGTWVDQFNRQWVFKADGNLAVRDQVENSETLLYIWTADNFTVYGNEFEGVKNIWSVSTTYVVDYLKEEKNEIWFNMTAKEAVMPIGIKLVRQ